MIHKDFNKCSKNSCQSSKEENSSHAILKHNIDTNLKKKMNSEVVKVFNTRSKTRALIKSQSTNRVQTRGTRRSYVTSPVLHAKTQLNTTRTKKRAQDQK